MNAAYPFKQGDLFALTVFLAVATHRSFHAAAVELEVTPSAVSHSIKALERRLGVRLLNRTTRSVAPTEAGERLAEQLRPALSSISQALHEVDEWRATPSGTVRINASEGAVRLVLRPLLAGFLREHPHIHLDIVCDGTLSDIVAEGFDAGIRLAEAVPQDMIAMRVSPPVRFVVIAAPGYFAARGRPATPQDLLHHNCIRFRFDSGTIYRWEFERDGVSESIGVTGSLTLTDQPLMVDAAIDGIGIAFVPEHLALEALHDGRLERALDAWCPAYPGLCLYYSGHRHVSGALKALIGYLRAAQS
ncbi:LysR family transcriptional regulator [Serratia marcescens]|uniref:LysR family transcriptional regulator n=1 Tax=Serratia marcescens TaxID=615 RepID=UPI003FA6F985